MSLIFLLKSEPIVTTATVTSQQLTSSFETITATGQQFAEIAVNGIDLSSNFENISSNGFAYTALNSVLANSEFQTITSNGFGNIEVIGNDGISSIGSIAITVSDAESISGITIQTDFEPIVANANSQKLLDGLEIFTDFGVVSADGGNVENATISINGINAIGLIGNVSATSENPQIYSSGQIKRYPANAFKNSRVKLLGIEANFAQNPVVAVGTSKINATIMVGNVVSFTQIANINADGILSISDDELILLMAA